MAAILRCKQTCHAGGTSVWENQNKGNAAANIKMIIQFALDCDFATAITFSLILQGNRGAIKAGAHQFGWCKMFFFSVCVSQWLSVEDSKVKGIVVQMSNMNSSACDEYMWISVQRLILLSLHKMIFGLLHFYVHSKDSIRKLNLQPSFVFFTSACASCWRNQIELQRLHFSGTGALVSVLHAQFIIITVSESQTESPWRGPFSHIQLTRLRVFPTRDQKNSFEPYNTHSARRN